MRVQPFANLDFLGQVEWDHYDHAITFAALSLDAFVKRSGSIKDRFKIDYQFEEGGQESLNTLIAVNLVYGFSTGASLERDLDLNENISNSFWLGYDSQCWGVKIVTERDDDDTSVMLLFNLLGLGDIKAF